MGKMGTVTLTYWQVRRVPATNTEGAYAEVLLKGNEVLEENEFGTPTKAWNPEEHHRVPWKEGDTDAVLVDRAIRMSSLKWSYIPYNRP